MRDEEIIKKMREMEGKTISYGTRRCKIDSWDLNDKVLRIGELRVLRADVVEFFRDLKILEVAHIVEEKPAVSIKNSENIISTNGRELVSILMESIHGLRNGEIEIDRAKAINESIKTVIDVAKTEIELIKTLRS